MLMNLDIYLSRFININMNVENFKMTYICKRIKYFEGAVDRRFILCSLFFLNISFRI